jgi:hypothetical protein
MSEEGTDPKLRPISCYVVIYLGSLSLGRHAVQRSLPAPVSSVQPGNS